jgi:hypothetical protein
MDEPKPLGRPTLYKPEYCQMLIDHMAQGFSFESFAAVTNTTRETLYHWCDSQPDFLHAKKEATMHCMMFWEKLGINNVLNIEEQYDRFERRSKSLNSAVWIFNMKNRFKWTDRVEVQGGDPAKPIHLNYKL